MRRLKPWLCKETKTLVTENMALIPWLKVFTLMVHVTRKGCIKFNSNHLVEFCFSLPPPPPALTWSSSVFPRRKTFLTQLGSTSLSDALREHSGTFVPRKYLQIKPWLYIYWAFKRETMLTTLLQFMKPDTELLSIFIYYRPQRSWGKVIFSQACVILFTGGGACVAGGVCCGRGHAWLGGHAWQGVCMAGGACVAGGVHGWGACMAGGHAWQGSLHGGGCMAGGHCVRDMHTPPSRYYGYGIQSMSGRYASYWNAFLFTIRRHFSRKQAPACRQYGLYSEQV